jgi:hypothetical protein
MSSNAAQSSNVIHHQHQRASSSSSSASSSTSSSTTYPSSPSSVVNGIKGWNQRHLYNYYGNPTNNLLDYYVESEGVYNVNLFRVVELYEPNGKDSPVLYKGGYNFPIGYFKTGKSLRIKGRLLFATDPTDVSHFDIRVRIENSVDGLTTLATSNNGTRHVPAKGISNLPVDFEIIVTSVPVADSNASTDDLYVQANGSYNYVVSQETNINPIYVPIWSDSPLKRVSSDGLKTTTNNLWLDFGNSDLVTSIKVVYLMVEELE